jgi:phosphohistidine phosphatase
MKRLFLLRHARTQAGPTDHERPLTPGGVQDAAAMGRFMDRAGYRPETVFCSSALRTRQTVQHLLAEWAQKPALEIRPALYQADAAQLAGAIRGAGAAVSVMIVAHNPGLEQCAALLTGRTSAKAPRNALEALEDKFPPGALAVLDFAIADWRDAADHGGVLAAFMRPADL